MILQIDATRSILGHEETDPGYCRNQLFEDLKAFPTRLIGEPRKSRNVSARARQTIDDAAAKFMLILAAETC